MGVELNNPWYGDVTRETRYAPWRYATVVALYPSVFDTRSVPAGPGLRSTSMMQHFAAYVRGANGLDGVAPAASATTNHIEQSLPSNGVAIKHDRV